MIYFHIPSYWLIYINILSYTFTYHNIASYSFIWTHLLPFTLIYYHHIDWYTFIRFHMHSYTIIELLTLSYKDFMRLVDLVNTAFSTSSVISPVSHSHGCTRSWLSCFFVFFWKDCAVSHNDLGNVPTVNDNFGRMYFDIFNEEEIWKESTTKT